MTTLAKIILVLTKAASFGSGLTSALGFLPPSVGVWSAVIFMGISSIKDGLIHIGDILDDGKQNDSFKP